MKVYKKILKKEKKKNDYSSYALLYSMKITTSSVLIICLVSSKLFYKCKGPNCFEWCIRCLKSPFVY